MKNTHSQQGQAVSAFDRATKAIGFAGAAIFIPSLLSLAAPAVLPAEMAEAVRQAAYAPGVDFQDLHLRAAETTLVAGFIAMGVRALYEKMQGRAQGLSPL